MPESWITRYDATPSHDAGTPKISLLDDGSGNPQAEDDDLIFLSPSSSRTASVSLQVKGLNLRMCYCDTFRPPLGGCLPDTTWALALSLLIT